MTFLPDHVRSAINPMEDRARSFDRSDRIVSIAAVAVSHYGAQLLRSVSFLSCMSHFEGFSITMHASARQANLLSSKSTCAEPEAAPAPLRLRRLRRIDRPLNKLKPSRKARASATAAIAIRCHVAGGTADIASSSAAALDQHSSGDRLSDEVRDVCTSSSFIWWLPWFLMLIAVCSVAMCPGDPALWQRRGAWGHHATGHPD